MNDNKPVTMSAYEKLIQALQQQINCVFENLNDLETTISSSLVPDEGKSTAVAEKGYSCTVDNELSTIIDQLEIVNSRLIDIQRRSIFYRS